MGAASAAASVTITGGTGNDTLIGSTGNDVINGGDGVDSIQIGGAGGNDSMVGGSGNDTFISINAITSDITANDSIAGGDGTDTLQFGNGTDGEATINLTGAGILANVSGIERIVLADTNTAQTLTIDDNIVGIAGGTLTVTTASAVAVASTVVNNTLSSTSKVVATQAVAQTLNYTLGNSIDDVTGNTAVDAFTVATSAYLSATDAIRGGAGADTITFSGAAAGVFTAAQLSGISSVETFIVDTDAGSEAYRFTLNDTVAGNNFSGTAFTVSRAAEAGTLNVQGQLVSYSLALTGGTAADTLVGGTGNDTIVGRADSAIDNLTGGAGNDIFHLDDGAIDVITDFNFGTSSTSVDVLLADISDIARDATLLLDTELDTITTGAASAAVAATDVLVVTSAVYADAAAVDTALEDNTALMTHDYLVIYQDTFGSIRVALADVTRAQNANNSADVTVVDLVQLTGLSMSTISTLISLTDFTFQG
jgi:Ca2+-binding RTX toxin-like protein